ncbi:DUF3048 domain-containing protein [Modestobacter sp. VKM Ac-2985]|uniref:DUF3048 domain-containing protein n=1 Tax=Modestobacter sp. VKM Ac-2985 TaxID=3004139 RepID=UPI0022AB8136|nr:DUF3048 domain-containing protein [Modestobacter sp. VKM Ac-2985]MCZ2839862.1 DUF3048 domain-containing protein [Modestobacter sp. VKM Ac-2985]
MAPRRSSADAGRATRRRAHRSLAAALLVGVALAGAAACGGSTGTTAVAESSTATPPPPPPPPPPVLWPLTGLESGPVDPRPALAVKVENSVSARPQTGLGAADLVWEQVVEGGITRYVAVYHSNLPARIGPIRSVRPMDAAIAAPLHGLFAFSGGLPGYVDAVADAGMQVLSNDAGAGGFSRTTDRPAPHNVHADPLLFLAQADPAHRAAPPPQFDLAATADQATAVTAGTPATNLALTLTGVSHPQWTWSPPDARWLRSEGGTPAVEADGARLGATNVVVLRVAVRPTAARDPAGNAVPETVLVADGEALVATGGKTVAATWVKTGVGERVVLRGADGNPVRLAPGNTWVELVPDSGGAVAVS